MNLEEIQKVFEQYGSHKIVKVLTPYISDHRNRRIETVLKGRLRDVQLAIEAPSDINNALAAVRTSEALGVSKIHLICPEGGAGAARSVTQGAVYWVEIIFYDSFADFLAVMVQSDVLLVGGTLETDTSLSTVPVDKPLCILVGNEQRGLSSLAKKACGLHYSIPMFGMTESLNLSVSAALSLYDITTRKRLLLGCDTDLSLDEQQYLRARYYLHSLSSRLSLALLRQSEA